MTKAERTRQFIIEKASPIFNTKGVAGTAMSDIMEATKLAKGSLYVHFESKEELSYCVADYNLKLLYEKASAAINRHESSRAKLIAFVDFLANPLNPPIKGGCPMINIGTEADDTNPVLLNKVAIAMKVTQQNIANIVAGGIETGEFAKDWNPDLFATKAFSMLEGAILIARVSGNIDHMRTVVQIIKDEIEEKSV